MFIIQGCKVTTLAKAQSPEIVTSIATDTDIPAPATINDKSTKKTKEVILNKPTKKIPQTNAEVKTEPEPVLSINKETKHKVHNGKVIVSTTTSTINLPPIHSITFQQIDSSDKKKKYTLLNKIAKQSISTSLFFGSLPNGKYHISGISVYLTGEITALNINDLDIVGHFIVTNNTRTDLGRLIVSEKHASNDVAIGRSQLITTNDVIVDNYFKDELLLTTFTNATGWLTPHNTNDIAEQLALSHPQGISNLVETNKGEIIVSTQLGTLLIRSQNSTWQVLSQNNNFNKITAVYPYDIDNNIAIVADEFGALYRIEKNGKAHTVTRGNLPEGTTVFIASSSNNNTWFIGLERNGYSELYQSHSLFSNDWQLSKKTKLHTNEPNQAHKVFYWHRTNGIGFTTQKETSIHCFDYSTKQWLSNPLPKNRSTISISTSLANDSVGILTSSNYGLSGLFSKTNLSHNCGETWLPTNSPYSINVSAPLFINDNFILESNSEFSSGGLYVSNDKNESWYKVEGNNYFTNTVWMTKYNGIFSTSHTENGVETLENTTDLGSTWRLEKTQIFYSIPQ